MTNKPQFVGEKVRLGDVLQVINGKNQKAVEDENGQYPIYGSGGQMGWASSYICPANTVIIGRKGNINKPIYVSEPFWNVDTAFGLVAKSGVLDARYLYHFCKHYNFEKLNTTCTIPSLTRKNIESIVLRLPSLEKQKEMTVRFDGILKQITLARRQLSDLDSLVKSRFVEMFGAYEPNCSIDDACVVLSGFAFKSTRYVDDGIRIMRIANVQKGYIEDKTPCYYPEADQNAAANYALREDDLLVSLTGNVGRVGLVTKELLPAALNQRVACLRPKSSNKLNTRYLFALLNLDEFEKAAIEASSGSAQKNLSVKWLKSHRIAIPPIEIQSAFDAFCKQVDKSRFVDLVNKGSEPILKIARRDYKRRFFHSRLR